jgi:hypothetical protein
MSREIGISILLSAVTSDKTPEGVLTVAGLVQKILGLQYSVFDAKDSNYYNLADSKIGKEDCRRAVLEQSNN